MGILISDRMSYGNQYMCSGEATSIIVMYNMYLLDLYKADRMTIYKDGNVKWHGAQLEY